MSIPVMTKKWFPGRQRSRNWNMPFSPRSKRRLLPTLIGTLGTLLVMSVAPAQDLRTAELRQEEGWYEDPERLRQAVRYSLTAEEYVTAVRNLRQYGQDGGPSTRRRRTLGTMGTSWRFRRAQRTGRRNRNPRCRWRHMVARHRRLERRTLESDSRHDRVVATLWRSTTQPRRPGVQRES